MDAVPLDFSERVAAAWKCCDSVTCRCVKPVFSTLKWTFSRNTFVRFDVFSDATGDWSYNFLGSEIGMDLAMSELLEQPDFKNFQIEIIVINDSNDKPKPVSGVGMEKLLKFVSFLANEPFVFFSTQETRGFDSPEGAMLLKWTEKRWFRRIDFWVYQSAFNRVLQKQFSRRIPTYIRVVLDNKDTAFFADQLRSSQMTWLETHCIFSSDVMDGIIQSFLRSPRKKKVDVYARFDDSTEGRLMEMEEGGLCRRVDGKFIFENPFHRLQVLAVSESKRSVEVRHCEVEVRAKGFGASQTVKRPERVEDDDLSSDYPFYRLKVFRS